MFEQDPKSSHATGYKIFYGYYIVAASFIIMVVIWAAYYSYGVFFKPLIAEFRWTRATTSGAFSLSAIINGLFAIVMGRLTDKAGPRIVMSICAVVLCLGFALMSQIQNIWQLYLFHGIIIGIGMGGSFVPLMTTVVRWFVDQRNLMTGIITAGVGIGILIGPPTAQQLIVHYGWRSSYLIIAVIVLFTVLLPARLIRRDPSELGICAYGEDTSTRHRVAELSSSGLSFQDAIRLLRFWLVYGLFFCLGFCAFALIVHITPHAIDLGTSPAVAANFLATVGGLSVMGRIVMGKMADSLGSKKGFVIGLILMSIALGGLVPSKTLWVIFLLAGVFGLAYGTCVATQAPMVAELFGLGSHGAILGFLSFGFVTGGAFGPWLSGIIFDTTGSYQLAFLMCTAVCLSGLVLTTFLKTKKAEQDI
jgi:MFS family permease